MDSLTGYLNPDLTGYLIHCFKDRYLRQILLEQLSECEFPLSHIALLGILDGLRNLYALHTYMSKRTD